MRKLLVFIVTFILTPQVILGASNCSLERQVELDKNAGLIKVSYKEEKELLDSSEYVVPETVIDEENFEVWYNYFSIDFINITSDYYVILENNVNDEKITINYNDLDSNGKYSYDWKDLSKVTTFTAKVYTSENVECSDEVVRTLYLTVPKYNIYHAMDVCEEYKEESICAKYITYENFNVAAFDKKMEAIINDSLEETKKEEKATNKVFEFLKQNKTIISISTGVLIIGVAFVVVILKRRNIE